MEEKVKHECEGETVRNLLCVCARLFCSYPFTQCLMKSPVHYSDSSKWRLVRLALGTVQRQCERLQRTVNRARQAVGASDTCPVEAK